MVRFEEVVMSLLRFSVISGAVLAISAGAYAADMPNLPPPIPTRTVKQVEVSSGWYLRGDLGYRIGRSNGAQAAPGFVAPTDQKLGNAIAAGIGAGIKTDWLRTDVTIDLATPMKYEATGTSAKVSAASFLFNGYLDLGTWYRATPYIGAGAGAARVSISDYSSTVLPPFAGDTNRSKWNFAWAGMAGIAYAISPNTMVDLGYRYLNLGDVTTGSDTVGSMTLKQVAAHEVRVGLRWSFDDHPSMR